MDLSQEEIDNFHRNQNNDDPLKQQASAILKNIFKKFKVVFYDLKTFGHIAETILQVKTFFQFIVKPV